MNENDLINSARQAVLPSKVQKRIDFVDMRGRLGRPFKADVRVQPLTASNKEAAVAATQGRRQDQPLAPMNAWDLIQHCEACPQRRIYSLHLLGGHVKGKRGRLCLLQRVSVVKPQPLASVPPYCLLAPTSSSSRRSGNSNPLAHACLASRHRCAPH